MMDVMRRMNMKTDTEGRMSTARTGAKENELGERLGLRCFGCH